MANSKVHVFTANGGVFLRTLMGHTLGVWCLTLISEGGGSLEAVVEDDSMELSSDDEGSGGGLFDPKILKAFRDSDKKGSTSKINLPKSTAAKSRKRARPSHAGRRSSHDAIGPDAATTLSGLGGTTASSPDFVIPGRNRPINFNFAASPPSAARYQTDPETPPGGDDEAAGPSHRARRMEQSDVCGAARGWGQKNPVVISGGCDRDVRVWDLNTG
jgi:F-box and WD-40 domain protein CDC4